MALIKCSECGKTLSDKAAACPHCGCPLSAMNEHNTPSTAISSTNHNASSIEQSPKPKTGKKVNNKNHVIAIVPAIGVIILLVILILTHTICLKHKYSDATILKPQTCCYCGKTKGNPKPLVKIEFPTKGIGSLLPIPTSNMGEVNWDDSNSFNVCVGNTTKDEFNTYVKVCSEYGFDVDYQKGDNYYYADDINGNNLNIWYEGNNIMKIIIEAPRKKDPDEQEKTYSKETTDYCDASGCTKEGTKSYVGINSQIEYYCETHYNELIDMMSDMEEDVGKGSYSKRTCEECNREGTRSIIGISGKTEYYCSTHYSELQNFLEIFE